MALKIANSNAISAGHERAVEEHISTVDPSHHGRSVIRTLLDSFEVKGLNGSHSCLVYQPTREPLSMYQRRFNDRKLPLRLTKVYVRALLAGLEYIHKECRVVHTGKFLVSLTPVCGTEARRLSRSEARKYYGLV